MPNEILEYNINEHRHRYAVWCASRAAQRGFAKTSMIVPAIDMTDIRETLESSFKKSFTQAEFDAKHRIWCRSIVRNLNGSRGQPCTYGRAAKLVAIYIKTIIIVGHSPNSSLATVAHPPVDEILLKSLAELNVFSLQEKRRLKNIKWTKLNEAEYFSLLDELKSALDDGQAWWEIEQYWRAA